MKTLKYNALEKLHNELNRGAPGDEVSLNIGGKEVLKIKFQTGGTATTLIDEFDWEDNGVPVSVAVRTDKDGYLLDGEINTGDYFRIVGGTEVLDETTENNKRYLQLKMADDGIWVLAERVRELANGDAGTPRPEKRPVVVAPTVKIEAKDQPKVAPVAPQPTNEDVMRSIAKLSQDIAKNKSLLEKIIDFLMSIFKFKK